MLPDLINTNFSLTLTVKFLVDEDHMKVFVLSDWLVIDHGIEQAHLHLRSPYKTIRGHFLNF